jgi:hypothetical protein
MRIKIKFLKLIFLNLNNIIDVKIAIYSYQEIVKMLKNTAEKNQAGALTSIYRVQINSRYLI